VGYGLLASKVSAGVTKLFLITTAATSVTGFLFPFHGFTPGQAVGILSLIVLLLVFDPAHPFPFLSNLSTSLAFLLHDPQQQTASYARVKVPAVLKQWIPVEVDIGSADWMYRNLSKRVEVVTPVFDEDAKARLWEILDICLCDRRQAWRLGEDGKYTQLNPEGSGGPESVGTHATLMDLALRRLSEAG
jgi:polyphosphate kinase